MIRLAFIAVSFMTVGLLGGVLAGCGPIPMTELDAGDPGTGLSGESENGGSGGIGGTGGSSSQGGSAGTIGAGGSGDRPDSGQGDGSRNGGFDGGRDSGPSITCPDETSAGAPCATQGEFCLLVGDAGTHVCGCNRRRGGQSMWICF